MDLYEGQRFRLHETATLVAWQTYQLVGAQAEEAWHNKFRSFGDYLRFFRPPFVIVEDEE